MATTNDPISLFLNRRHPDYEGLKAHWDFLMATYRGGRAWFDEHIFKYYKEGDNEFKDRIARAYRFNHSREVVDLVNKYVFKGEIHRNYDDADDAVTKFWAEATRDGQDIDQLMRHLSKRSSIFGRIWVVVDTVNLGSGESKRDAQSKTYAYDVTPQNALDMSFAEDGSLNWIVIRETTRDDADPLRGSGRESYRYRLWTRTEWVLYVESNPNRRANQAAQFQEDSSGKHNLGIVPVFPVDHMPSDSLYSAASMIGDVAYLDRACANYLSNLDAIIQDQTFSQLAIPAQGMLPGEESHTKVMEAGTKRIFTYDAEGGQPFFLSPDPKQAELIITSIRQIINEIYHSLGISGERTKQDNAMGIDNSSGVAKAYDFDRVNSLLVSKANSLERAEYQLMDLVSRWARNSPQERRHPDGDQPALVAWPVDFETRGLIDELDIANRFELLTVPIELKRHQLKQVLKKLYPHLPKADKDKLLKAIDDMTDDLVSAVSTTLGPGNKPDPDPSDDA